jgi:hypothetical protein
MLTISVTPVPLPYKGLALFHATLVKSAIVAGIAWRYLGVLQAGSELLRSHQPVEKPLYASSGSPSRAQNTRHCSVLDLISKCLDAVLDYSPLL